MTQSQDRRMPGVNRVAVARLVDICGRDATVPAFEAESVEVSGRGMHVKTPYLPPLGAPLVCRLEDDGREIVVEGVVAWQSEHSDGGEFGVQFTALDSGSVEALKSLCGLGPKPAQMRHESSAPGTQRAQQEPEVPGAPTGAPVKLHIDGLGAPMKARVKGGSPRKLQVGSNLEFLKVGKNLQIEDVEQGEKRGARIDAVSIALDPETQVPQLVVVLRYEGEDRTPEPSVVGGEAGSHADDSERRVASAGAHSEQDEYVHGQDEESDDEAEASAAAMRGPVDQFASQVGKSAIATSQKLAAASGVAAKGFAAFVKAGGAKFFAARAAAAASAPQKRRSTAPAPQVTVSREPRLRPQNGPAKDEEVTPQPRKKTVVIAGALGLVLVTSLALGFMSRGGKADTRSAARTTDNALEAPPQQPAAGTALQMPALSNAAPAAQNGSHGGVVANVPLFGPTSMATVEPAPLGPSPDEITASAPKTRAPVPGADEERLDDEDPRSVARDESFDDGDSKKKDRQDAAEKDKSPEAIAEAVKPFGLGKMHLPVVYRIKLDKPGAALEGRSQGSGFTVTIPGRKVDGSSTSITKRDDRISEVKMKNGPTGAAVTFVFRSKVPGYKVRLRKSYIEVFVSSPDSAR